MKHATTGTDGPLSGARVLDFGQYVAGPAVAMMLADQGADVIRIDPPGGPLWSSPANAMLNRGKRSIVLDLKRPTDRSVAQRLVVSADVLIENFRPGVMRRLGLDPSKMSKLNPRLIYLSLPGFPQSDERRRGLQAWEGVVAAAVGMYNDMGLNRQLRGLVPSYTPLPLASAYAAGLGALAVAIALYARRRSGRGEIIEVPLGTAVLEGLAFNSMVVHGLPDRYRTPREQELERRLAAGEPMNMTPADLEELLDPFYENFLCSDGRPFYVCCAGHGGHTRRLLEALGLWEQLLAEGLPTEDPYRSTNEWAPGSDCTVYAYPLSRRWMDRIRSLFRVRFRQRTSFEWEEFFAEHRIPGAAQRTTQEWLSSAHALASALVVEVDDDRYGSMKQAGVHAWIEGYASRYAHLPPARPLDADREEILASLSDSAALPPSEPTGSGTEEASLPLAGVRILDCTNVIAGPTIGSTLARFGADVVKIDAPRPLLDPSCTVIFALQCGRGKRSVLLDLKRPEGQQVLQRLACGADAIIHNGPRRQLTDLGLDVDSLARANPRIVVCQFSAFDGPLFGPRSAQLGYDDLIQASTGIMARFGGSLYTPEEHAHVGTVDVMAGFLGAFSVVLGLIERDRRQRAVLAGSSLAAAGQLLQAPFMHDFSGRPPFDEPSGPFAMGERALYRLYETADGWLFLGAHPAQLADLARICGLMVVGTTACDDAALQVSLEERLRTAPAACWESSMQAVGIGAQAVGTMARVRAEHLVTEGDWSPELRHDTMAFIRHDRHPCGHTVDLVAPTAMRLRSVPTILLGPAPKFGEHTVSVLRELGYTRAEVRALLDSEVAATSWSRQYLPD